MLEITGISLLLNLGLQIQISIHARLWATSLLTARLHKLIMLGFGYRAQTIISRLGIYKATGNGNLRDSVVQFLLIFIFIKRRFCIHILFDSVAIL